jgi:phage gp36-like protein
VVALTLQPPMEMPVAYSILTDLKEQLSETELIQLTDDAGAGVVDTSVTDRAIADADTEIDGYVGTRLEAPLDPVPDIIRKLGIDIAIYNLFSRRHDSVPETRKDRYRNAIAVLSKIAEGKMSLGANDPAGNPPAGSVSYSGKDQVMTTEKLTNF